jgi:hypothetical protein
MKKAIVTLKAVTPYSPSRHYSAEIAELKGESKDQYDERTWRHHAHVNRKGLVIIPGECFAWCVKAMSKRRSDKIPGKRGQTFTKVFDSVEVVGEIETGLKLEQLECEGFLANSDGVRGSGKRVYRRFPIIRSWQGRLTAIMWDDQMTEEIFSETVKDAGLLIGVGRRRPENKGFFGRYAVTKVEWHDRVELSAADLSAAQ